MQKRSAPVHRRRPALCCVECRRRKLKCDRKHPCTRCRSKNVQCAYNTLQWETYTTAQPVENAHEGSYIDIGQSRLQVDRYYETQYHPINTPSNSSREKVGAEAGVSSSTTPSECARLESRVKSLERHDDSQSHNEYRSDPVQQPRPQQPAVQFSKTRIRSWSHWLSTAPEFSSILACHNKTLGIADDNPTYDDETENEIAVMGDLLRKCKSKARSLKVDRPSRSTVPSYFNIEIPPREFSDRMIDLYFGYFESSYRILHVPSFRAEYESYWRNPTLASTSQRLQILLVIAIGCGLVKSEESFLYKGMIHTGISVAQIWLSGPLEKDRLNVPAIQVFCLLLLARLVLWIGGDLIWGSIGSLVHMAMLIGLHRDPKYLTQMTALQAETRRRLWATITELGLQAALDSGMSPRISLEDYDTAVPANINDDDVNDQGFEIAARPDDELTSTSLQRMLLKLLPCRLKILKALTSLRVELTYSDALSLDSELTRELRECSKFIKDRSRAVSPFRRNFFSFLSQRYIMPLHCPFIKEARANPLFAHSIQISMDTAIGVLTPEPDEVYSRLRGIGGGILKDGMGLAATIVSFELFHLATLENSNELPSYKASYAKMLRQIMVDLTDITMKQMEQGETNIKMHMFMCMILAQADAIQSGENVELRIAQSAQKSLRATLAILEERSKDLHLQSQQWDQGSFIFDGYLPDNFNNLDFDMGDLYPMDGFS